MAVITKALTVKTKPDLDIVDITGQVQKAVQESKVKNGIVTAFVPGSTASISTMEFEPNLVKDVKETLEKLVPKNKEYHHHETWGDDNGHAHVRATMFGPSANIPFKNGKLLLGTWQQLVLLDFDVPAREREIILQIIGE